MIMTAVMLCDRTVLKLYGLHHILFFFFGDISPRPIHNTELEV
jgi:hypothetical protein